MKNRRERASRLGSGLDKTKIVYGDYGVPELDRFILGREEKVTPEKHPRPRDNLLHPDNIFL